MALFRLGQRVEGWVRWSNPVCATSRMPCPTSPWRTSETFANRLAANALFRRRLANPQSRLEHLGKVIEIGDSRFSKF